MKQIQTLVERKLNLSRKMSAILRLASHLDFSRKRLRYPVASIEALDETALESVSALVERFGKLQDLLGAAFREIVSLSGENATDMNDVLSRLEKIGVLPSADNWRALRALRNLGAHDYDDNDAGKTGFINEIATQSETLMTIAVLTTEYARNKLNIQ